MQYFISALLLSGLLLACGGEEDTAAMKADEHMATQKAPAQASGEKLIYYTCPMESHKHIHSSEPGSCSECGMPLVKAVVTAEDQAEFYGCPMEIHSHIRHAEPGRCEECNMELKPMRLEQS